MTIKIITFSSPLCIHGHWTKDDLDWTPLSWVTPSQSLDLLCFSTKIYGDKSGYFKFQVTFFDEGECWSKMSSDLPPLNVSLRTIWALPRLKRTLSWCSASIIWRIWGHTGYGDTPVFARYRTLTLIWAPPWKLCPPNRAISNPAQNAMVWFQ